MKKTFIPAVLVIILTATAFHMPVKITKGIQVSSTSYFDLHAKSKIHMVNEFTCTEKSLYWSMLDRELPVVAVTWKVDKKMQGSISYTVDGDGLKGSVFFDLTAAKAKVSLDSEWGPLKYDLTLDTQKEVIE